MFHRVFWDVAELCRIIGAWVANIVASILCMTTRSWDELSSVNWPNRCHRELYLIHQFSFSQPLSINKAQNLVHTVFCHSAFKNKLWLSLQKSVISFSEHSELIALHWAIYSCFSSSLAWSWIPLPPRKSPRLHLPRGGSLEWEWIRVKLVRVSVNLIWASARYFVVSNIPNSLVIKTWKAQIPLKISST